MKYGPQTDFGAMVHQMKYRHPEESFDDYCVRYARKTTDDNKQFYRLIKVLREQILLPAGRQQISVGRPYQTTAFNCMSGDTEVFTDKGWRRLDDLGEANVLSPVSGTFEQAQLKSYGKQLLYNITISHSFRDDPRSGSFIVKATKNHRWILQNETITDKLEVGDILKAASSDIEYEIAGWVHGFVYGDGTKCRDEIEGKLRSNPKYVDEYSLKKFGVRLCGRKNRHLSNFIAADMGARATYPPSNDGDAWVVCFSSRELKKLPDASESAGYMAGFVRGLLEADGCFSSRGNDAFQFHGNKETVLWMRDHLFLADYAPVGGMRQVSDDATNYGPRGEPLWCQLFRPTITHLGFKVIRIEEIDKEDVFCVEEPKHRQFVLRNGLRTGNCFVGDTIPDDTKGIFDTITAAAMTLRTGGGCGWDFSTLRPDGELVRGLGVGAKASGPVSFMHVWHSMCGTIMSAGERRGAMMGVLRCLKGDTKIHTVNGNIPISQLVGKRPYLFACDPKTKKMHVVKADKIFVSDRNRKVIKIKFDTRDEIVCTPDHLIMLKNGTYKAAGDLKIGDRVTAIEHSAGGFQTRLNGGYVSELVGATGGKREYVYRLIAEDILLQKPDGYKVQVHHKDENRLNNDPDNLQIVNVSEHAKLHADNLRQNVIRIAEFRKGKTWEETYGKEWAKKRKQQQSKALRNAWAKRQRKAVENHRVIAIEDAGVEEKVYDISLPKWHNFVANSVFVHNCDHPDILKFVRAKMTPGALTNFNISVAATDEFMEAVMKDGSYKLRFGGNEYGEVRALDIWGPIMEGNWDNGEPGILFIDKINKANPLRYCETISATNPCAEQPLPPNGACLLGSINLLKLLMPSHNGQSKFDFDYEMLADVTDIAVRTFDNVIDRTTYPLEAQRQEALAKRRMGVGVTGIANAIETMGHPYASLGYLEIQEKILSTVAIQAYRTSCQLAKEKGTFPLWVCHQYIKGEFFKRLPEDLQEDIKRDGLRNGLLTSIAPTGTISLTADNVSGGIEPVYQERAIRRIKTPDGDRDFEVTDAAFNQYGTRARIAQEVAPLEHVAILCNAQKWVDSSISKTINITGQVGGEGPGTTFAEFKDVYLACYEGGAKGCATFNSTGKRAGILRPADTNDEIGAGAACVFDPVTGTKDCG